MTKQERHSIRRRFRELKATIARREERIQRTLRSLSEARDEYALLLQEIAAMTSEEKAEVLA
jgi:hypothetical protein